MFIRGASVMTNAPSVLSVDIAALATMLRDDITHRIDDVLDI